MPDKITLAEGTGGLETSRFIRNEILSRFGNPLLSPLEDSSWIRIESSSLVITTDSFIIDPPLFPGGDIGKLAISGVVNDLIASGAIPKYITLSLILSEGVLLGEIRQILDSISEIARHLNVAVVAGDTKVIEKNENKVFISVTGIGSPLANDIDYSLRNAMPGDKIIVTGTIGDHGLAVLSFREGLGFEKRVLSDCAPLASMLLPIMKSFKNIHSMRDPTRGGLLGVLIDIAESSQNDVFINLENIPIKPEVNFGCEMLGLDPLQLVNEGKMVLVVGEKEAQDILSALRSNFLGRDASVIGEIRDPSKGNGRLLIKKNATGETKIAARPEGIILPRLC